MSLGIVVLLVLLVYYWGHSDGYTKGLKDGEKRASDKFMEMFKKDK